MKNYKTIGISVTILAILIGLFFFFSKNKAPAVTSKLSRIALSTLSQGVIKKETKDDSGALVPSEADLAFGNFVKTVASGRALISGGGYKTVLDYSSELEIKNMDKEKNQISIFLSAGSVWSSVEKVFDKGEYYEVETQNAVAVVRGTKFEVNYSASSTNLYVAEGRVGLIPVDEITRERHFEAEIFVTAGMKGTVDTGGNVTQREMTPSEKQDSFYLFNLNRDENNDGQGTAGGQGTLRGLMENGKDMICSYDVPEGGLSNTSTFYISGNSVRADFIVSGGGTIEESHMIQDSDFLYSWSEGQGMKIARSAMGATGGNQNGFFNFDGEYYYNCKAWQKDVSKFVPPRGVSFTDLSSMMQGQMPR